MRNLLRQVRNRHWWIAHRDRWPSKAECLSALFAVVILVQWHYVITAHQATLASLDALVQNQRILKCLNNQESLGTVHEHGADWAVQCNLILRKQT